MKYVSTRGQAPAVDFEGAVLEGLAPDGGLYVPAAWPQLDADAWRALRGASYVDVAVAVMAPFVAPTFDEAELRRLCEAAYATFDVPEVAPLREVDGLHVLELFHGPTLAFKDVALQLLGRFFDALLERRGERVTVLGATSGDTGSAAIEGCRGRDRLDIFILHPHGRTSDVQRRQMTTVLDDNVHNIALRGTFDDCQDLVKALFRDPSARGDLRLTAVNSINWARVLAQIVYYATAALQLGAPDTPVRFTVPTGNFGDIFAGWCAARMGLPIERLVIATNANDILARTLATGTYARTGVQATLSPSMDIQVSSNFERLLYLEGGEDPARVSGWMDALATEGAFTLDDETLGRIRARFGAATLDDAATLAVIRDVHARTGVVLDPHTAIAFGAASRTPAPDGVPSVVLATAHPAKFPDAVREATGTTPALPGRMVDLFDREERYDVLSADEVEGYVRARSRA